MTDLGKLSSPSAHVFNAVLGQRVRRTAPHKEIPIGMLGTIDVVHEDGQNFWVVTDGLPECGAGFCGWTSFEEWTPIGKDAT